MTRRLPPLNGLKAFETAARSESFTRAAQELGISRVWLYKKLKKYGIVRQPRPLTVDR